jgi:TrmH family RNA methyltransferase
MTDPSRPGLPDASATPAAGGRGKVDEKRADPGRLIIVLSRTTEPANIGATCRAMKTMGLSRLRLIAPLNPHGRTARALAHGAEDLLEAAEIHPDLESAVADAVVVAGTTARQRQLRKHALMPPAHLAERLVEHSREGDVVLLFGTERTGLSNEEADICRYLSRVDTADAHPSLNLAMAVMIYAWEIRQAFRRAGSPTETVAPVARGDSRRPEMRVYHPHRSTRLPTQFELDTMYAHLSHAMEALDYSERERRKFLTYIRQLHMRAGIVDWEMQIYHLMARRILELAGRPAFKGQ